MAPADGNACLTRQHNRQRTHDRTPALTATQVLVMVLMTGMVSER
jgi:hypothetical protein